MVKCTVESEAGPVSLIVEVFDPGDTPVWRAKFGSEPSEVCFFEYTPPADSSHMELLLDLIDLALETKRLEDADVGRGLRRE